MENKERMFYAKGNVVDIQTFTDYVTEGLEEYHYADASFMARVLSAKKEDIKEVYDSKIMNYIRGNKDTTIKPLCNETYVKSRYVFDLIADYRIEAKVAHSNEIMELREEEKEAEQDNKERFERKEKLEKLQGIQALFDEDDKKKKQADDDKPRYRFIR